MAMNSILILITLCFASLISHGLSQNSASISPENSNFVDSKASALECWSALFELGWCYGDLVRAARSGKVDIGIGPTCCKAAKSMNSGCWPKIFPYNPFFPQIFREYCSRIPLPPPPPKGAGSRTPELQGQISMSSTSTSVNAQVPAPNAEGPISIVSPTQVNADVPTPDTEGPISYAPFALPLYAPSPITEGLFDTPRGEGPIEQPWIHF